jgi:haloalkane dehalogenase
MTIINTPDARFENLPDYPFAPNYLDVGDGLKMHYVDEGPHDGKVVLLLHGEPSWSFLYRKMIPVFVAAGYRTIAPDLIGFGKSSKPTEQSDYSYAKHLKWMDVFVKTLDLQGINAFLQDWGGLIGLRNALANEDRYSSITVGNTFLSTGEEGANEAFMQWQIFSQKSPHFDIGTILQKATVSELSPEVVAAYNAPFPDETYKAGARIFPTLVPITADAPEARNNKMAWGKLVQWTKPFLTLFSDTDPIMNGLEKYFIKHVPGAKGQPHEIIKGGGHFLQEDKGEEIAEKMINFLQSF